MMNFCVQNYDVDFISCMENLRIVDITENQFVPGGVVLDMVDRITDEQFKLSINHNANQLDITLSDI